MGTMIFNGISTVDLGVVIQSPPVYDFPNKDYEVIHVDGKNGDVVIDKGSYQNSKRTYFLASAFRPNTSFIENAVAIAAWLNSASGYARLEDSYEPSYYRLAMFKNPGAMMNYYDLATVIQVSFDCKPQRYLKSGEDLTEIQTLDTYVMIVNPTNFIALPRITIEGNDLTITIIHGDEVLTPIHESSLSTSFAGEAVIDSELQECYKTTGYVNNSVSLTNGFPKLYPGINWIKVSKRIISGSLTKVSIKPNWWTL